MKQNQKITFSHECTYQSTIFFRSKPKMSSLLEDKEGEKEEGGSNVISGDDVGVAMRSGGGGAGGMGRLAGK